MGVKYLWDIIDDARTIETLDCLRGKTIAIDLSIWIVEAIKTLQYKSGILKPHLRNIFFRILFLRRLGVKLIAVTEGEAPDLKQATMKKRAEAQYGVKTKTKGRWGRSRFQRTIDECTRMLDLIGVPHVRAQGEAEAMCAAMNKHGLVDGCLTNDGDFFLYGGETIYRDFGINPKDQNVLVYTTKRIKERTGLNRHDMIALGLLNGCDYTEGVPGVGKKTIKKFLEEKTFSEDLLIRFQRWNDEDFTTLDICSPSELCIYRKLKGKNICFPNDEIIDEFLVQKDRLDELRGKMKWVYPSIKQLQEYLLKHLEWPEEYTLPKILQLATSTYLEKLSDSTFFPVPIEPKRIVKTKCQMGVSLVDIDWQKYSDENSTYSSKWQNCPESFITLENQQVVSKTLPQLVNEYNVMKESKKKAPTKKRAVKSKTEEQENTKPATVDVAVKDNKTTKKNVIQSDVLEDKHTSNTDIEAMAIDSTERVLCNDKEESRAQQSCLPQQNSNENESESESDDDGDDENLLPSLSERLAMMKLDNRKSHIQPSSTQRDDDSDVKERSAIGYDNHEELKFGNGTSSNEPTRVNNEPSQSSHVRIPSPGASDYFDDECINQQEIKCCNFESIIKDDDVPPSPTVESLAVAAGYVSNLFGDECVDGESEHSYFIATDEPVSIQDDHCVLTDNGSQSSDSETERVSPDHHVLSNTPSHKQQHGDKTNDTEYAHNTQNQRFSKKEFCVSSTPMFSHELFNKSDLPDDFFSQSSDQAILEERVQSKPTFKFFSPATDERFQSDLVDNFFSPKSDQAIMEVLERVNENASQNHQSGIDEMGLLKESPVCLDVSTPVSSLANNITPISSREHDSSCMRDVTNFSNLGDSILGDAEDDDVILKDGGVRMKATPSQRCYNKEKENSFVDYEKVLRRKLNLNLTSKTVDESVGKVDDSVDNDVLCLPADDTGAIDSPLCLADRLKNNKKLSMRSRR